MKKLFTILFAACALAAAAVSCYDDKAVRDDISDLKERVGKLEEQMKTANLNISALQTIVSALEKKVYVNSVKETEGGYEIKFSDGTSATISNGHSPVIGIEKHQGVYYWTLDGNWLLDRDGAKIPVTGKDGKDGEDGNDGQDGADAIAPRLRIDDGWWYISTDGGVTWEQLGKATGEDGEEGEDGDSFFKEVSWDDEFVYLTLADGSSVILHRGSGPVASIAVIPDYGDGSVKAGTELFTIRFMVEPESAAPGLLYLDPACFTLKAAYTLTKSAEAGELITLPILEMEAGDGVLTVLTRGTGLDSQFEKGELGVSAALFISDGESLALNTGFFPLWFKNEYLGHEYVDLGLSVKWASANVGATKPEGYGSSFAWGETNAKNEYTWSTYKFRVSGDNNDNVKFSKYCSDNSYWGGTGPMDNKTVLDLEDDAARAKWGGSWRMPTGDEWKELLENCTCTWTSNYNATGFKGLIVTGKKAGYTDKSIFLPSAGIVEENIRYLAGSLGTYMSSSLCAFAPYFASIVDFSHTWDVSMGYQNRFYGMSVRPVLGKYERKSVTGVSLYRAAFTMAAGTKRQLDAKVEPADIKTPRLSWTSEDESVAVVSAKGVVTAVSEGTTTVTVTTVDGGFTASCTITVVNPSDIVTEAVDLGLSVKWATFNVGATTPDDFGDYFAWGETKPKSYYSGSTYKWFFGDYHSIIKYGSNSLWWGGSGPMDNKTILDIEDDAAYANWGEGWRMPTFEEWGELMNKCTSVWTDDYNGTGISGRVVTATNGNSIFLPAAGYRDDAALKECGSQGLFWSSSLFEAGPHLARDAHLYSDSFFNGMHYVGRPGGFSVRPVYGEYIPVSTLSLNKPALNLKTGEKERLYATIGPSNALAKDVHWVSDDTSVATVDSINGLVTAVSPGTATITVSASSGICASCTVTVK